MSAALLEKRQLAAVAELERLCFANPWSEGALAHLFEGENFGVVALEGDRVSAYVGLAVAIDEGEITNVATHPDLRRKGHAREALVFLLDEAKKRGLVRITLEVRESNQAAQALYASLGFRACGRRKNFYRQPREDGMILEKKL